MVEAATLDLLPVKSIRYLDWRGKFPCLKFLRLLIGEKRKVFKLRAETVPTQKRFSDGVFALTTCSSSGFPGPPVVILIRLGRRPAAVDTDSGLEEDLH